MRSLPKEVESESERSTVDCEFSIYAASKGEITYYPLVMQPIGDP